MPKVQVVPGKQADQTEVFFSKADKARIATHKFPTEAGFYHYQKPH